MAQRITEKFLRARLRIAQSILCEEGYPVHDNYQAPFKAGCLMLDHNHNGYQLEMTFQDGCSGVVTLSDRLSASEMCDFLAGLITFERIKYHLARAKVGV